MKNKDCKLDFLQKKSFWETQINSLLQRYNLELEEKIQNYKKELNERRTQLEEQKNDLTQRMTSAFIKGDELDRMLNK